MNKPKIRIKKTDREAGVAFLEISLDQDGDKDNERLLEIHGPSGVLPIFGTSIGIIIGESAVRIGCKKCTLDILLPMPNDVPDAEIIISSLGSNDTTGGSFTFRTELPLNKECMVDVTKVYGDFLENKYASL